jgi:magnesium transporter
MSKKTQARSYDHIESQILALLVEEDEKSLRTFLARQHPADIADVIDRLNEAHRDVVFALLSTEKKAEVLDEMSITATKQILGRLPPADIGDLLDRMPMDEAAEILSEDVPDRRDELLAAMSPEQAAEVQKLLQYPPQSAGHLMTEKFIRLQRGMTADEVLAYIREANKAVEPLTDLYVLEANGLLVGVLSLRDLVIARPSQRVDEIMNSELVTVTPETDQEEVARIVSLYDYLAIPVVNDDGVMLGVIPVDDVIDILVSESTEDFLKFGGLEGGAAIEQPYFTVPIPTVIRKRLGWLLLLFVAETLTGIVLRYFETELTQVVALSFFIPLLIGTGGNTGAQTVSTLIRGLALGEVKVGDIWRVIFRELANGVVIGILLGAIGFARALLWGSEMPLAITVGLTVVAICTWANTIGALIPLLAHRFSIDPAVVSAPLITTLVDATGLAIYLLIAKAVLNL